MSQIHVVSYSELDAFKQCPHKHRLAYKDRWQAPKTGPALVRGVLWHEALEEYYKVLMVNGGITAAKAAALAVLDKTRVKLSDELTETVDLVAWMLEGYIEHWGSDDGWRIVAVEHNAEVPLRHPSGRASKYVLKVKIDLVVKDLRTNKLWIVDHKTCGNLPNDKELDLDDQFGLYTWAMREIGRPVVGSIYSAARTRKLKRDPQPLDERFQRYPMRRTDVELDTIAAEHLSIAKAAYGYAPGDEPRHTNTDTCKWKCPYTEPCLASRKGMDEERFLTDTGFRIDKARH